MVQQRQRWDSFALSHQIKQNVHYSREAEPMSDGGGASLLLSPEGGTFASFPTASPISYANPNYNENKTCTKEQHCAQRFGYQRQRFGNWFRVEE
jgi:hypothetical protein